MELFWTWLPYYLMGYVGMLIDVLDGAPKKYEKTVWVNYLKGEIKDIVLGFLAYNAIVFMWATSGFEFMGMVAGVPTGMILLVGFASKYMWGAATRQFKKQIAGETKKEG